MAMKRSLIRSLMASNGGRDNSRRVEAAVEPAIGAAVAVGILRREELPEELLRHVAGLIEFYEADDSAS
jgi:hypothetical protein